MATLMVSLSALVGADNGDDDGIVISHGGTTIGDNDGVVVGHLVA